MEIWPKIKEYVVNTKNNKLYVVVTDGVEGFNIKSV